MDEKQHLAQRHIDWLKDASPEDWHRVALDFDRNQPIDSLFWIVRQQECDKATALKIFWDAHPQNFLRLLIADELSDGPLPRWEMVKFIAQRFNDGGFSNANIAFDATSYVERDFEELAGYESQLAHSPLKTHREMKQSIVGRKIELDGEFAKRYPKEFHSFELSQELLAARQMEFLQNASPDDWHRYAWHHNWDERLDGLFWIVSQPQCDRATALLIFWKGEPTGYDYETEEEKMGNDIYAVAPMLRYIAERFNTSGYARSEIAYDFLRDHGCNDPEYHSIVEAGRLRDVEELIERQRDLTDPHVKVHPDMKLLHIAGRQVGSYDDSDFDDLIPQDVDGYGVELSAPVGDAPRRIDEPEPNAPDTQDPNGDASARVRAMRRQADLDTEGVSETGNASSFAGWLKRLFGR